MNIFEFTSTTQLVKFRIYMVSFLQTCQVFVMLHIFDYGIFTF